MSDINAEIAALAQEIAPVEEVETIVEEVIEEEGTEATEPDIDEVIIDDSVDAGTDDITTIAGLADAIEVDAEYLYGINVPMGDNQEAVPLGQLKDKYQDAIRDKAALEVQIRQKDELITNAQAGQQQGAQVSQALQQAQATVTAIQQQYQNINWGDEEQLDPGGAALKRQKFQEAFNNAQSQVGQVQQAQVQQAQVQLQQQGTLLMQAIPAWTDKSVMGAGQKAIKDMLMTYGYTEAETAGITDHRQVVMMNKFAQMLANEKAATESVKTIRSAPKVLKGRGKQVVKKTTMADNLAKKAQQTGDKGDKLAAVKALLGTR